MAQPPTGSIDPRLLPLARLIVVEALEDEIQRVAGEHAAELEVASDVLAVVLAEVVAAETRHLSQRLLAQVDTSGGVTAVDRRIGELLGVTRQGVARRLRPS